MLHKSELLKVTVDDIDNGQLPSGAAPVNILRERTFNPELSSLLNRIYTHEKVASPGKQTQEMFDPSLKISMLQKCDELIYSIKHKDEAASVSSHFNPFRLDINVYDDIDDLNDYIQAGMKQAGFSRFLILKYNFKDAAFRTELNRMDEELTSDLFFSIKDPFFRLLTERDEGVLITHDYVYKDPFMYKKLHHIMDRNEHPIPIYLVKMSSLCGKTEENPLRSCNLSLFETYLSPIIAVLPDSDRKFHSAEDFYQVMKSDMQIPFSLFLMKNRFMFDSAEYSYENALLMIDLFKNSPASSKLTTSLLTLQNYSVKDNIFILKYLLSKIKKRLERNSLFLRISINRCIMIASENEKADIIKMVDEINSFENIITLENADNNHNISGNRLANLFL